MASVSRGEKVLMRVDGLWRSVDYAFVREGDELFLRTGEWRIAVADASEDPFTGEWTAETIPYERTA